MRFGAAVVAVISVAGVAHAQPASDEFTIERFQLAMDRSGVLDVDSAEVPGHLVWSGGAWTGFAHDPLVAYTSGGTEIAPIVDRRLTTGLFGSIGLGTRVAIGLAAGVTDYQHGLDPVMKLPSGGIGDLRLTAKLRIYDRAGWRLALVPVVTVPVGSASGFLRESGPTFTPQLAVSARFGRVRAAANLGYRIRERLAVAGLVVDDEAIARIGLAYEIATGTELAWSTSFATDRDGNQIAAEILLGGAHRFTRSLDAFAAGGLGLDNAFGTPDWRFVAGVRFERSPMAVVIPKLVPELDPDHDGIVGAADRCPDQPEDKDGFEDGDGCPDPDNDHDGILDADDKCPNEPEDKDGFKDDDGCPDPAATITGHVVDAEDRPIAGAAVHVEAIDAGTASDVTTDASGDFKVTIEGDAVKLTATAPEHQPTTVEHHASAGRVEIKLARTVRQGQLRGQVQSFDGKPLAATIKVTGAATTSATADADGRFSVDLAAGSYQVEVEAPGYVTQRRTVTVKLDGVTVLNVDLRVK